MASFDFIKRNNENTWDMDVMDMKQKYLNQSWNNQGLKQLLRHVGDSCNKFIFISNHHSSKFEAHMIRSSDVEIVLYSQDV